MVYVECWNRNINFHFKAISSLFSVKLEHVWHTRYTGEPLASFPKNNFFLFVYFIICLCNAILLRFSVCCLFNLIIYGQIFLKLLVARRYYFSFVNFCTHEQDSTRQKRRFQYHCTRHQLNCLCCIVTWTHSALQRRYSAVVVHTAWNTARLMKSVWCSVLNCL
jgi:hypothetical protein